MQKVLTSLALVITVLFSNNAVATNPAGVTKFTNSKDWNFIENKGQLSDENDKPLQDIKYYGHNLFNGQNGVNLYCKPNSISFVFAKQENNKTAISEATAKGISTRDDISSDASKMSTFKADMILVGANKGVQIIASDQKPYYENFYSANIPEQGILNVSTYKTITYKNIYPNIDMVLHAKEGGMKYEFVVYPGGQVSDIQIKWNGLEKLHLGENGAISYALGLGNIKMEEQKPVSFQGKEIISSSFIRKQVSEENNFDNIGFKVDKYNKTKILVIDPTLLWGTYFGGGAGTNQVWSLTTDVSGNVYISGSSASSTGIATSGAYQSTYGGATDAVLAKFNSTGAIQWSTYYGLKGTETAHSVTTDHKGNVFITGATTSQASIATSGAYQTKNTAKEGFLIQFTSAGARNWGTYFGGGTESSLDAATDTTGNIYILGETTSKTGVASSGAFQTSIGGGSDLFLAKFSNNGTFQWSTYFGGSGTEVPGYLVTDIAGNIFINANSTSTSGLATSGAYQTSMAGGALDGDALFAKFNSSGSLVWCTYFGGANDDYGTGITIDSQSNLYITGSTGSSSNIATSGGYQTNFGGTTDAFLAKFTESGTLIWSTYFGGSDLDNGTWLATDINNNVYMTGGTQSSSGIATTGSYQTSLVNGSSSSFLSRFNSAGTLEWATYYGPSDITTLTTVATSPDNNVYMSCNTTSSTGIATSGAYQTSLAGSENGYLLKFNMNYNNDAGITSIINPSSLICSGSDTVKVQLKNYGNNELDSVLIFWTVNGKNQPYLYWKGNLKHDSTLTVSLSKFNFVTGNDTIKVFSAFPNQIYDSMPYNDTAMLILHINPVPGANAGSSIQRCFGNTTDAIGATAVSGDTYSWTSYPGGFSSTTSNPTIAPNVTTTYYLTETITATGCNKTDSVQIIVNPLPAANAGSNGTICYGTQVTIGAAAVTGSNYNWISSPSGFSSTMANPVVTPNSSKIYILTVVNKAGCIKTDSVTFTVNPLPVANAGSDATICSGISISIGANTDLGSYYNWTSSPAGYSSTMASPIVSPTATTLYILTETNAYKCSKTDTVIVLVNQLPIAKTEANSSVCIGTSVSLGAASVSGSSYIWTSAINGFTSTSSNPVFVPSGSNIYILTEINTAGCSKTDSVSITVNPLPIADAGKSSSICYGASTSVGKNFVAGNTYHWSSSPAGFSSTSSNPSVKPASTTIYYLSDTITATGCSKKDSVTITVNPLPANDAGKNAITCANGSVSIGMVADIGSTYSWTSSPSGFTSTSANASVTPTVSTIYILDETNSFGCSRIDSVTITTKPLPDAHFTLNYIGDDANLKAIDSIFTDASYQWILGDGNLATGHNILHLYPKNTSYPVSLTVIDTNGCTNTFDSTVNIVFSGIATDISGNYSLGLYPNPFHTSITLKYNILKAEKVGIALFDMTGRPISIIEDTYLPTGVYSTEINTEKYNLSPGVYMLRFTTEVGSVSRQVVKF